MGRYVRYKQTSGRYLLHSVARQYLFKSSSGPLSVTERWPTKRCDTAEGPRARFSKIPQCFGTWKALETLKPYD